MTPWATRPARLGCHAQQLVHAMREENDFAGIEVVVNPEVISSQAIAIPMSEHDFHGHESEKTVGIQHRLQTLPAPGWVGLDHGSG